LKRGLECRRELELKKEKKRVETLNRVGNRRLEGKKL